MEENPFKHLKISSLEPLMQLEGRVKCSKCNRSMKYYCYYCGLRIQGRDEQIPKIKLPVKIDIIRHPVEETGRNTAVHACILAPDDVTMYTWPEFPDYEDKSKIILVYPGEDSVSLADIVQEHLDTGNREPSTATKGPENNPKKPPADKEPIENEKSEPELPSNNVKDDDCSPNGSLPSCSSASGTSNSTGPETQSASYETAESSSCGTNSNECNAECDKRIRDASDDDNHDNGEPKRKVSKKEMSPPFDRVIFVDATWHYSNRIGRDERLKGVKHVELKRETSKFWRYQHRKPDHYLATIEAVYYFLREYHEMFDGSDYDGRYDDLLFLFMIMYQRIRQETDGGERLKVIRQKKAS